MALSLPQNFQKINTKDSPASNLKEGISSEILDLII